MATPAPSSLPLEQQGRMIAELDGLEAKITLRKILRLETATVLGAPLPATLTKTFKAEP